jgi:hypothetical protein
VAEMTYNPVPYVEAGAAWLDAQPLGPKWIDHVDLGKLRMSSDCDCVLGQTGRPLIASLVEIGEISAAEWSYALGEARSGEEESWYGVVGEVLDRSWKWTCEHGFCLPGLPEVLFGALGALYVADEPGSAILRGFEIESQRWARLEAARRDPIESRRAKAGVRPGG